MVAGLAMAAAVRTDSVRDVTADDRQPPYDERTTRRYVARGRAVEIREQQPTARKRGDARDDLPDVRPPQRHHSDPDEQLGAIPSGSAPPVHLSKVGRGLILNGSAIARELRAAIFSRRG